MRFLLVTFGLYMHKYPDKDHIYLVSYTAHVFTYLTAMWNFEVLLIVLFFITFPFHTPIVLFQDTFLRPFLACRLAVLLVMYT